MNGLVMTETTFYPVRPTEKGLIGFSSLLFDNKISLHGIAVYLRPNGDVRLLFPKNTLRNGKEIGLYYPINRDVYELMREAVAKKVKEVSEKVEGRCYGLPEFCRE